MRQQSPRLLAYVEEPQWNEVTGCLHGEEAGSLCWRQLRSIASQTLRSLNPERMGTGSSTKSSGFHKMLNMEQSSVAVGASRDHQIQPPLPTMFGLGERVRKKSGAAWQGHIVGWYSTKLTPEGYAVESEAHPGSVQIYPVAALERVA